MSQLPRLIRWLTILTRMGFPISEGLRATISPELAERLARGDSLAQLLPPGSEREMVEAAQSSPRPLELLEKLGETLEAADRLRARVRLCLLYPRLLTILLGLELLLLVGMLAPMQLHSATLNRPDLAAQVAHWQWLLRGGSLVATVLLLLPLWRPEILWTLARRLRFGPGQVGWLAEQALWAHALAHLLEAGRDLPGSLGLAGRVIRGQPRRGQALALEERVARGDRLGPLLAPAGFEPTLAWAVEIGEAQQNLASALQDAARTLELEVELRAELQMRLLEPLALVLLALPVLLVVLSFWIPQYCYLTPSLASPRG